MTVYSDPTIEYGFDEYGNKVEAINAIQYHTYKCPCCNEKLVLRKGSIRVPYFAHNRMTKRTPRQKMCPWYKGDGKYTHLSDLDKLSITNGGIPLYLCEQEKEHYQLQAVFPILSDKTQKIMDQWNVKVQIGKAKAVYSVGNLRKYSIIDISNWIGIDFDGFRNTRNLGERRCIKEIKEKWGWGIRGLDINCDLFHAHDFGGFRVADHSNVVVGKHYYVIMLYKKFPTVEGIHFVNKGILRLKNWQYYIYDLCVEQATSHAKIYIQSKGYQLIEKNDSLIPVWPPAAIVGKEFVYHKHYDNAYIYHRMGLNQEIEEIWGSENRRIYENNDFFICNTHDRILVIKDTNYNKFSGEIRVMAVQDRGYFYERVSLCPELNCKDSNGGEILLDNSIVKQSELRFSSNISGIKILALAKHFVVLSTQKRFSCDKRKDSIIILLEPFGKLWFKKSKCEQQCSLNSMSIDINAIVKQLYSCKTQLILIPDGFDNLLYFSKNNSKNLYKLLMLWKQSGCIPYAALKLLLTLQETLKL
jgi:hypothetical protein